MCADLWYTRPQILEFNGVSLRDFSSHKAALEAADRLVSHNMQEYGHPGTKQDGPEPLFDKFLYIRSGGVKRKVELSECKAFTGEADVKPTASETGKKRLLDSGLFEEVLGPSSSSSGAGNIKLEFSGHGKLLERTIALRFFLFWSLLVLVMRLCLHLCCLRFPIFAHVLSFCTLASSSFRPVFS